MHYDSLLNDFEKSIKFVRDSANPAMDFIEQEEEEKKYAHSILLRECGTLLSEVERLERSRDMQNKRLKNVMNLVSLPLFEVHSGGSMANEHEHDRHLAL